MKILYDLSSTQAISGEDFHGGGEYAKTVFHKLLDSVSNDINIEVFYDPKRNIDISILEKCKLNKINVNYCNNNGEISNLLNNNLYDIFYTALPYSYTDLIIPSQTKFIYTIHGLRSLECFSDYYELKYTKNNFKSLIKHLFFLFLPNIWKNYKIRKGINNFNKVFTRTNNQTIITVSNHSKYSIANFFPNMDLEKINVLFSPSKIYNKNSLENPSILDSLKIESGKYILIILGDRFGKGAYRACKALVNLFQKNSHIPEYYKVLILGVSYKKNYLKLTNNSSRFIFHKYVSAEDLEYLYKNAHIFLYPTLNEGFGYPPLEAMKYGTLCLCSANSSITEVCGDSVIYFNPFDEMEISTRILQSFDENIRKEKIEKMKNRHELISKKQEYDLERLVDIIKGYNY